MDAADQDEHTRLLAYAFNYAAATDEEKGMIFALKGLFGGYPGVFSIALYYKKVHEYSDLENRDLWEYRLNLSAEQIERLLMHLWELQRVYADYYFLDENCSYHLLSVLDVALLHQHLTEEFRWWAIPTDTLRAVVSQPGLLAEVTYRPARSTLLRRQLRFMRADEQAMAEALVAGRLSPNDPSLRELSETQQARVLEFAFEYLEYQRLSGKDQNNLRARRPLGLLAARSQLSSTPSAPEPPAPEVRPDESHGSSRFAIGYGQSGKRAFTEITFRPAYHDLLDPDGGYGRGAQIEFLAASLRYRIFQG